MRSFLVAGSPAGQPPVSLSPGLHDHVIAADSGAHHARKWGWPVHVLVGDLDSAPQEDITALVAERVSVITAPIDKDETDLELALAHALGTGAREIVICAALAGRPDHMLANILLLARPELAGLDVVIAEGPHALRLLRSPHSRGGGRASMVLAGQAGDLLSLLPVGGDAAGITTQGLRYPLRNETLYLGQARGISNVFEEPAVHISLRRGMLLVYHRSGMGEQARGWPP